MKSLKNRNSFNLGLRKSKYSNRKYLNQVSRFYTMKNVQTIFFK